MGRTDVARADEDDRSRLWEGKLDERTHPDVVPRQGRQDGGRLAERLRLRGDARLDGLRARLSDPRRRRDAQHRSQQFRDGRDGGVRPDDAVRETQPRPQALQRSPTGRISPCGRVARMRNGRVALLRDRTNRSMVARRRMEDVVGHARALVAERPLGVPSRADERRGRRRAWSRGQLGLGEDPVCVELSQQLGIQGTGGVAFRLVRGPRHQIVREGPGLVPARFRDACRGGR